MVTNLFYMNSNMFISHYKKYFTCQLLVAFILLFGLKGVNGQNIIQLDDLSSFKNPGKSWHIAGDVHANLNKANDLVVSPGLGTLVNQPTKKNKGEDLFTQYEHGDIDLELDYMMGKEGNSGIYLQGLYEFQLLDSWGNNNISPAENGGIYERWDEKRPEGQKGYQGYSPRQNVGRAPGLWQHLQLSFQAPRFDDKGNKIENAKILKAFLNGVLIHENVELFGPTRGAISQQETTKGPLRFQGDHGAVAFRNIKVTAYDKVKPVLKDITYKIYEGRYDEEPSYDNLPPEAEGTTTVLTANLKSTPQKFLIRYEAILEVKEAGEYGFELNTSGGSGMLKVGEETVIPIGGWSNSSNGKIKLNTGEFPLVLLYSKYVDWETPALGLQVYGPGIRTFLISDIEEMQQKESVDPILVSVEDTPILRSFMDIPNSPRITHAVSVGSSDQIHYTYDLDHGALAQVWRGGFLEATPMWHERGDGSSRPQGSVEYLVNQPALSIARLATEKDKWLSDTTGSGYRPKGYVLNNNGIPTFRYFQYGVAIEDEISPIEGGKGFQRNVNVTNPGNNLYFKLAEGATIKDLGKGLYLIDDKAYYLRIDNAEGAKAIVRTAKDQQELVIPVKGKLTYSILF